MTEQQKKYILYISIFVLLSISCFSYGMIAYNTSKIKVNLSVNVCGLRGHCFEQLKENKPLEVYHSDGKYTIYFDKDLPLNDFYFSEVTIKEKYQDADPIVKVLDTQEDEITFEILNYFTKRPLTFETLGTKDLAIHIAYDE